MRLFLALLFLSAQAWTIPWSELEHGETYTIKQSFELPYEAPFGSALSVMKGQKAVYKGLVPVHIPGFPMILYMFDYKSCPGMQAVTEVESIEPVQPSGKVVKVGAQLDEYCVLQFYVEGFDWKTESIFE